MGFLVAIFIIAFVVGLIIAPFYIYAQYRYRAKRTVFCAFCRSPLNRGATVCAKCGRAQPTATAAASPPVPPPPPA